MLSLAGVRALSGSSSKLRMRNDLGRMQQPITDFHRQIVNETYTAGQGRCPCDFNQNSRKVIDTVLYIFKYVEPIHFQFDFVYLELFGD